MAKVDCSICNKGVDTTKANYVFANGIHQHKKCPKARILTEEEEKARKELTDAILYAIEHNKHPRANWDSETVSWTLIAGTMKKLKNKGYSYEDQEYALHYAINQDNGYWGYGRVNSVIEKALAQRDREKEYEKQRIEYEKSKKTQEVVLNKPSVTESARLQTIVSKPAKKQLNFLGIGSDEEELDWM